MRQQNKGSRSQRQEPFEDYLGKIETLLFAFENVYAEPSPDSPSAVPLQSRGAAVDYSVFEIPQ